MDYNHKCYKSVPFSSPISLTDSFISTYVFLHSVARLLFLHLFIASIRTNITFSFCFALYLVLHLAHLTPHALTGCWSAQINCNTSWCFFADILKKIWKATTIKLFLFQTNLNCKYIGSSVTSIVRNPCPV